MRKKRTSKKADKEAIEKADEALRALSRRYPEGLAQLVLRDERIEHAEWLETQIAVRELRMDRVLHVRLVGGRERRVHGEWTDRLNKEVARRIGEYHLAVSTAGRIDADAANRLGLGNRRRHRLESVVVVLRGRKRSWPEHGAYRTAPNKAKFCGVHFGIEPVYQRTVAELEARGCVFWLAFVPLAIDVDEEKLSRIIERLRDELDAEHFAEMAATMLSMARLNKDAPSLVDVIRSLSSREVPMHPCQRIGLEEGLEKGLAPLVRQFERRLGRPMTDGERRRLVLRMDKDGPDTLGDVVLDLSSAELALWLAPRKSKKRIA